MKKLICLLMLMSVPLLLQAEEAQINWIPMDRALKEGKKENKHILIEFYSQSCGYCRKMKKETYADRLVAERISRDFKAVSIDIEGNKMFEIGGKKISESDLSDDYGITMTPTTYFLRPDGEEIRGIPGYMSPEEIMPILSYVGEGWYEKMGIVDYLEKHRGKKNR